MTKAKLRFSTEILRRLGEELNPNPDQGIIEIVKNAYDADALTCSVHLNGVDKLGGSILIVDDGDGMELDDIYNGWLVLGKSQKTSVKRTRLNRIPAGNKGLGRLAALRMGIGTALSTRPRAQPQIQYDLYIDWQAFDQATLVDEVDLIIDSNKADLASQKGTEILIEGLKSKINRNAVKRLARALILLADPFGDNPLGFQPKLIAPEFTDLEKLVQGRYFQDAEYQLDVNVDNDGFATAKVLDWKGKTLFEADHQTLRGKKDSEPYQCPKSKFNLWVFLLNQQAFSNKPSTLKEVRRWLQEFGGVHLYENGLRVSPYGNPGNDWLEMNLSRVRSPEFRPGTNSSIGRVSIENENIGQALIQKTDRSGFIETEQFHEIKRFAKDAMDWMARRRLALAEQRRARERQETRNKSEQSLSSMDKAIEDAPPATRKTLRTAFNKYTRDRDHEVRTLRKEVQLYRTLSTAGITAATFSHESSRSPIKIITQSIKTIERRSKSLLKDNYEKVKPPIESIKRSLTSLSILSDVTLSMLDKDKRRPGRVDVHKVIKDVIEMYDAFIKGKEVKVAVSLCSGDPYLQGSDAAVESVITNLLNNSLTAFEETDKYIPKRIVHIKTELFENMLQIQVADNGPGIQDIDVQDIWLPGESTRRGGTGLGLTIVRDTIKDLDGSVRANQTSELGGAEIIIDLPIIGF